MARSASAAARLGDRLFTFGMTPTHHGPGTKSFAREYAAVEPPPAPVVNVTNNTVNNSTTNNTTVNNTTNNNVTNVDVDVTKISVDNTIYDVNVLAFVQLAKHCGFFDPDNSFFVRTKAGDQPLLQVGQDAAGQRHLIGKNVDNQAPAPKNRRDGLYLYHQASNTLIPFGTDKKGQFAIPLPDAVHGPVQLFSLVDGEASGAGIIDLP